MTHEAGWAHAPGALRGPAWLREPQDPNALVSHLWSRTATKVAADAWTATMLSVWNADLWLLRVVLTRQCGAKRRSERVEQGDGADLLVLLAPLQGTLQAVVVHLASLSHRPTSSPPARPPAIAPAPARAGS